MSYCLLKNAFPKKSFIENLENVEPVPEQVAFSPKPISAVPPTPQSLPSSLYNLESNYQPVPTPLPATPQLELINQAKHTDAVSHLLECIKCRDVLMYQMSFYDKNREIVDAFPYIILIILLILIFKKL